MDIRHIDLNLLKTLDALLAGPGVSGAARRLGLSQPATSAALARLRDLLGDPLLVRRGNRMMATPRAEALRPLLRTLLDDVAAMLASGDSFDPATSTRRFRVLANEYATLAVLMPLVERLRRSAPGIDIEILPFARDFEERLASHGCDLVVGDAPSLSPSRHVEMLYRDAFVSLCRHDHPRLGKELSLEQFLAEDHILVASADGAPSGVDRALTALGRSRRVAVRVPHLLVAAATISATDLVGTLPRRLAESCSAAYGLRLFETPLELASFEVGFAWHPRSAADAATRWLKDELRSVAVALRGACAASDRPWPLLANKPGLHADLSETAA